MNSESGERPLCDRPRGHKTSENENPLRRRVRAVDYRNIVAGVHLRALPSIGIGAARAAGRLESAGAVAGRCTATAHNLLRATGALTGYAHAVPAAPPCAARSSTLQPDWHAPNRDMHFPNLIAAESL